MDPIPCVTNTLIQCPLDGRAIVVFHPDDLQHRSRERPGWWTLRDKVLPELRAGRMILVTTSWDDYAIVEVGGGMTPFADEIAPIKAHRFTLEADHGRVFVGPVSSLPALGHPDGVTDVEGAWVDLMPGTWAVDVELVRGSSWYRMRFTPAVDASAETTDIPYLGPGPREWDRHLVRDAATERALADAVHSHAPRQREFLSRIDGHDRFDLDQETGEIVLHKEGEPMLRARFHAIGSFGFASGTWRWAWANETLEPALRRRCERLRAEGARRDLAWLLEDEFPLHLDDVARLAALAADALGIGAWYAAAYDEGMLVVAVDESPLAFELPTSPPAQA